MRHLRPLAVLSLVAVSAVTVVLAAPPSTMPGGSPTTRSSRPRMVRLTNPWNKVPDLTDEQKGKINALHEEAVDKIRAVEQAEDDACYAVLTEEQRKALEETLDQEKAARKAKAGKKE